MRSRSAKRHYEWREIRRVDQTGWISPAGGHLTLDDSSRVRLIYPGDVQESAPAVSDAASNISTAGAHRWRPAFGKSWEGREKKEAAAKQTVPASAKCRLMSEEDEAEIEAPLSEVQDRRPSGPREIDVGPHARRRARLLLIVRSGVGRCGLHLSRANSAGCGARPGSKRWSGKGRRDCRAGRGRGRGPDSQRRRIGSARVCTGCIDERPGIRTTSSTSVSWRFPLR